MSQCWVATRAARQHVKLRETVSQLRRYSQAVPSHERVSVPCRSNGEISLDIRRPTKASAHNDVTPKVIIFLPRGLLWSNEQQETSTLDQLGQHLPGHHIVRVNYRMSPQHQYPTPVHDTLAGYDWTLHNILTKRAISRLGRADHVGRLAVCGELIGGGLASMLALTECRAGEPGIIASAVNNPLVDWASLSQASASPEQKHHPSTAKVLDLRRTLFSKPDRYFDPFASPLLLFRTAGLDVPLTPAEIPLDDMALLSLHEREEYAKQHAPIAAADNASETPSTAPRKSSRHFPSPSLNLRLPSFHISSGPTNPFSQQAEEFTHLLRQSYIRQACRATSVSNFGRKVLNDEEEEDGLEDKQEKQLKAQQKADAAEKAQLQVHRDLGLWDGSSEAGRERLRRVAAWLGEKTA